MEFSAGVPIGGCLSKERSDRLCSGSLLGPRHPRRQMIKAVVHCLDKVGVVSWEGSFQQQTVRFGTYRRSAHQPLSPRVRHTQIIPCRSRSQPSLPVFRVYNQVRCPCRPPQFGCAPLLNAELGSTPTPELAIPSETTVTPVGFDSSALGVPSPAPPSVMTQCFMKAGIPKLQSAFPGSKRPDSSCRPTSQGRDNGRCAWVARATSPWRCAYRWIAMARLPKFALRFSGRKEQITEPAKGGIISSQIRE